MLACARFVGELADDEALVAASERMPARLANALELDWSAWRESLPAARAAFVAARGYGFGPAREIALKLSETVRLPALGYSAAELRHGPRAAIDHDTPVLALRQQDATADTVDGLVADLKAAGENVFLAGGPASTLPWMGDDHPVCDPVVHAGAGLPRHRAHGPRGRARPRQPALPEEGHGDDVASGRTLFTPEAFRRLISLPPQRASSPSPPRSPGARFS